MKNIIIQAFIGITVLSLTAVKAQDTVTFKSGKTMSYQVLEYDNGILKLKDSSGKIISGNISAVKHIKFGTTQKEKNTQTNAGKTKESTSKKETTEGSPAGSGFSYKNVRFSSEYGMVQAIGEMTNSSGQNYQIANFVLSTYDANGGLLSTGYANISTFANGNTKSFQAILTGVTLNQISKYKIQFENGL